LPLPEKNKIYLLAFNPPRWTPEDIRKIGNRNFAPAEFFFERRMHNLAPHLMQCHLQVEKKFPHQLMIKLKCTETAKQKLCMLMTHAGIGAKIVEDTGRTLGKRDVGEQGLG
jgi:hypothetical protein